MAQNRIDRINEEVRWAMSNAIRKLKDPRMQNGLISVTRCDVTRDFKYCKTFVSVFGTDEDKKLVMQGLKSAGGFLRREISHSIDLRYMPELVFQLDESIETGARINQMINDLQIPTTEEESDDEEDM